MKKTLIFTVGCLTIFAIADHRSDAQQQRTNVVAEAKANAAELGPKDVTLGEGELLTGIPGRGDLTQRQIRKWLADPEVHRVINPKLPLGLAAGAAQIKGLDENPLTHAKIELGRQLYFDTRLSADNTISCASCHHPDEGFGKNARFGVGIRKQEGGRNSPVSLNRILSDLQFWDGRADSLEAQAVGPIANPIEMGHTHDAVVESLTKVPGYVTEFRAVFGGRNALNIDNVGKAIAAFERAIVSGPTPFDYYEEMTRYQKIDPDDLKDLLEDNEEFAEQYNTAKAGAEAHPMSESAIRGRVLFFSERVNCAACHVGANLADEKYHNLGIGLDGDEPDLGRYVITEEDKDWGAFKTPTIRNVALSPPYMHDGSLATLMDVVEHYSKGGNPNKGLSDKMKKLDLTAQEKKDLVAFMEAVTGPIPKIEYGRLPPDAQ